MDTSVALMNQYALISAQFPPIPSSVTTPASSPESATTELEKPTTSAEAKVDEQKPENEENSSHVPNIIDDSEAGPSKSEKNSSIETLEIDGNIVTIEDIGPTDPNDPISEVRRRRLQRFEAKSQES